MKSFLPELVNPRVPGKSEVEQSGVVEPSHGGRGRSESQWKSFKGLPMFFGSWLPSIFKASNGGSSPSHAVVNNS